MAVAGPAAAAAGFGSGGPIAGKHAVKFDANVFEKQVHMHQASEANDFDVAPMMQVPLPRASRRASETSRREAPLPSFKAPRWEEQRALRWLLESSRASVLLRA